MNNYTVCIAIYLIVINIITFLMFYHDKRRSKKNGWRIPEKSLIGFCLIGGSVGGMLGMHVFHHKTNHPKFTVGIPIIFILQIGLVGFLVLKVF